MTVEGDDPLEICVRITGSEGETVIVNVDTEDGTATGIMHTVTKYFYSGDRCNSYGNKS